MAGAVAAVFGGDLAVQGLDVHYLPGPEFGKFIDSETEMWGRIIREADINKP